MRLLIICALVGSLLLSSQSLSDELTDEQKAMKKLDFLIGNWAGQGNSFNDYGEASDYFDTEEVSYDVNQSLIVIRANGYKEGKNTYSLHTVIHYDSNLNHYWYQPFTAKGARKYQCNLVSKKLLCVNQSNNFKLTFQRLTNGQWNEFGEKLNTNGIWMKTFETKLDEVKN